MPRKSEVEFDASYANNVNRQGPEYQEGLRLGRELANGHAAEAATELSQYVQQLDYVTRNNPGLHNQKLVDILAGLGTADPRDVHFSQFGNTFSVAIDWNSERRVNSSSVVLSNFNPHPQMHPHGQWRAAYGGDIGTTFRRGG
jgi:hypothetical protein